MHLCVVGPAAVPGKESFPLQIDFRLKQRYYSEEIDRFLGVVGLEHPGAHVGHNQHFAHELGGGGKLVCFLEILRRSEKMILENLFNNLCSFVQSQFAHPLELEFKDDGIAIKFKSFSSYYFQ